MARVAASRGGGTLCSVSQRSRILVASATALLFCAAAWWWGGRARDESAAPGRWVGGANGAAVLESVPQSSLAAIEPVEAAREPTPTAKASADASTRRFRLVDDETREAVAHFELRVGGVELRSDAEGIVEIAASDARIEFELREHTATAPDRIQTRRDAALAIATTVAVELGEATEAPHDVAIPVGPTYRLAVRAPRGVAVEALQSSLRSEDASQMFDVGYAPVRDAAAPWTRFKPTAKLVRGGPGWRLILEAPDGLWTGAAIVPSNVGVLQRPVEIVLEERARLDGVVREEGGAPINEGLVRIERDGADFRDFELRPLYGRVGAEGRFSVRCAPPGEYRVRFHRETFLDFDERITLTVGATREIEIVMRKLDASRLGRIEGRIESSSGRYDDALYPYLRPDDPALHPRNARVEWRDESGRRVGRFAFDEVRLGDYTVGVRGPGLFRIEPGEQRVRPNDAELVFVVRDEAHTAPLTIAVELAEGLAPPSMLAELTIPDPSGPRFHRLAFSERQIVFEAVPVGERCRYKVSAEGCKPIWGEVEVGPQGARVPLELERGWGTELFVTATGGAPIEGARVYFDDELAGVTDARGELRVALDAEPSLARVEHLDWRLAPASRLGSDGRFRTFEPFLSVVLEPAQH